MNRKGDAIAVFDSGVGGISVLRQLRRLMPGERFLYYGDSANAPYGTRPTEEVRALSLAVAEKLMAQEIKALVVACNTATAAAINMLRSTFPDLIIVGVEPALKPAALRCPGGTVGVIATPVTLREEKFLKLMQRYQDQCRIVRLPAPGLAELVEAGKANSPESRELLEKLLQPWQGKLDVLVLGCTHYPFAAATIRELVGPEVPILDGGEGTARETLRRLEEKDLLQDGPGEICFQNSSGEARMLALSQALLDFTE